MVFLATTVKVYEVPLTSPEITAVVAPVVFTVLPPGRVVTVYPEIVAPPLAAGAVQDTVA